MTSHEHRQANVYIIGAQSTGKTTLVNAVEVSFADLASPPTVIREVARTVLKDKQYTRDDIRTSPARALELQHHILDAQFAAEEVAGATIGEKWYLSDRSGLDPIVYAHLYAGQKAAESMLESRAWEELEVKMKAGVVILCGKQCFVSNDILGHKY